MNIILFVFNEIKEWWTVKVYPSIDAFCDKHTKGLLIVMLVLAGLAVSGAIATYINLKLNKGYVEKINAAQEIVKTQKATITDLTKELQDMVDSMQKLSTNKAAEHEISNKMADIINTTIEKTNSTIQDITDNQNSYNALVDKYDKENANNETAN